MKRLILMLGLGFLISMAAACASQNASVGGTEFGNPDQTISGSVTPPQAPSGTTTTLRAPCGADAVIGRDSKGQERKVSVGSDCKFSLTLPTHQSYSIDFTAQGAFVARLVANPGETFPTFAFFLSPSEAAMDLGSVQLKKDLAIPSRSILSQMDRDGDGQKDDVDLDDDKDGVPDGEEKDCDLDGFLDDDDAVSTCAPLGSSQPVLQVSPFQGQTGVGFLEPVQVRFGCAVNTALFTPSDFVVKPSSGSTFVPCTFTFSGDVKTLTCDHSASPFLANTSYEGILQEIDCQDGSKTQPITWSWTTTP